MNLDDIAEEGEINYLLSVSKQLSGDQGQMIATSLSDFLANLRDKLLERGFSREEAIAIICRLQHLKT